jgi:hypothetical protein
MHGRRSKNRPENISEFRAAIDDTEPFSCSRCTDVVQATLLVEWHSPALGARVDHQDYEVEFSPFALVIGQDMRLAL